MAARARIKMFGTNDKVAIALNKKWREAIDESLLRQLAEFMLTRIQGFTRSGKSLASNEKAEALKPLSDSYIAMRQGAVHFRRRKRSLLGRIKGDAANPPFPIPGPDPRLKSVDKEFFRPDLSNLTFTGQLLRSLKYIIDARRLSISINPTGKRKGEKINNQELANIVSDDGRPFLGLDDKGRKNIVNQIRAAIRRTFK